MRLHEDGRLLLVGLMKGRGDSLRKLASVAGYTSHSYIGRLLDPDDPSRTVSTDAGHLIAEYYGLEPERFFVLEATIVEGRNGQQKSTSASRRGPSKQTNRQAA